ncbi:formate/nitrite transporter family protein [Spiroplasma culicicola]|uniref:Formate/nitrite transporter n=1 Tax=Spiroplasma culicicola AES-1 TaxID=1276246 RepID=W6A6T7_9MOLU|nr:formate/nitrite transporter family protein [Spiroplasma culicicola]AHI52590.1 formate/nitrite transporter [Spiroplasma culicicola AES-1]
MNEKQLKIQNEIDKLKQVDFSSLEQSHGFMADGIVGGFKSAIHKMHYTFVKQILLGILSGIIIGFGYVACLIAMLGLPEHWAGFGNVMLGIFFPGCIILITFLGGGLYTSHVVATIPMFKKTVYVSDYLKGIFGVMLGNFAGTLIFVMIFAMAGGLDMKINDIGIFEKAYDMGLHKLYRFESSKTFSAVVLSVLAALTSGILCNIMVSATLPLTSSSKHPVGALFVIIFPITFFAMSGYQHGPANTFFFWSMIVSNIFPPEMGENSILHNEPQILDVVYFFFINLIPTFIGNWIGGAIFLPGLLHLINKEYTDVFFKKARLEFLEEKMTRITTKLNNKANKSTKTSK